MSRLGDLLRRFGRSSYELSTSDDYEESGARVSIGGFSIPLGRSEPDRDHDGIPDRLDPDTAADASESSSSGDSDDGDSGRDD